jgi:hypothetical protein
VANIGDDAVVDVDEDGADSCGTSDDDDEAVVVQKAFEVRDEENIGVLVGELKTWLTNHANDASRVEEMMTLRASTRSYVPKAKYDRDLVMRLFMSAYDISLKENEAAEMLMVGFPRIFLRKNVEVRAALEELIERRDVPQSAFGRVITDEERRVRALTAFAADRDVTGIYRVLDHFSSAMTKVDPETVQDVAQKLFTRNMEHEVDGDEREYMRKCGLNPEDRKGIADLVTPGDVKRWAFRKARRAADLYGWSGKLMASMIAAKPAASKVLAYMVNKAPGRYVSGVALSAMLREAKGTLIPKMGVRGAWRPVATTSFGRRIWSGAAVKKVRKQASAYCEKRGQLGLAKGGASIAYATMARMVVANGGTVCTDDKKNSFGSIGRKFVIEAVGDLVKSEPSVNMEIREVLEAILTRTFVSAAPVEVGEPTDWDQRTVHTYVCADGAWHTNHALTQGSAESTLLEAVTYASLVKVQRPVNTFDPKNPPRAFDGQVMHLGMHDDAITLALSAATAEMMKRIGDHAAGAKYAPEKSRAMGRLARQLVEAGTASVIDDALGVLGIPIGADPTLWIKRTFIPKFLQRILVITTIARMPGQLHLAATVAKLTGGPAAMCAHWMAATPPSENINRLLDVMDRMWVGLWVALTGIDAEAHSLRLRIERHLYAPGPDGFGHRRCRDAHRAEHASGVVRGLPMILSVLSNHNLRTFGTTMVN